MITKKALSITLDATTITAVKKMAVKEKRSLSQMIDLLLQTAIKNTKDN